MRTRSIVALTLLVSVAACQHQQSGEFHHATVGGASALVTDATYRLVTATPIKNWNELGRFKPEQVLCAEPSPDVAKAVSAAFNAGISIDFQGQAADLPADLKAKLASSIAKSRSESLAQLTERLPTIQLLRDGLFRACEAYGNGAISPISYSLLLSRYGDTMVTLLGSELVAGDFGRQLAALGGSAGGEASASLNATDDTTRSAERNLERSGSDLAQKTADVAKAQTAADSAAPADKPAAQSTLNIKQNEKDQAEQKFLRDLVTSAKSNSAATSTAGAALVAQTIATDRAQVIAAMQRDYMQTPSLTSLLVACVTALDRSAQSDSSFYNLCNGENGILKSISSATGNALVASVQNQSEAKALPLLKSTVQRAVEIRESAKALQAATPDAADKKSPTAPSASTSISPAEQVRQAQVTLKELGFDAGPSDGIAGRKTTAALKKFQQSRRVPVTGLLDDATGKALASSTKA
jgi:hypothetical protein